MTDSGTGPLLSKRHIAAIVAGNALELYDFLIFSFFALPIGRTFFPSSQPETSLLAALASNPHDKDVAARARGIIAAIQAGKAMAEILGMFGE